MLVLPFLLVGLCLYGVAALFIFLFLAIKGLILFFSGRSLYEDLPEDVEAKKRLSSMDKKQESVSVTSEDISSALNDNQPKENPDPTTDPFYVPEYLKEDNGQEASETIEENQIIDEDVQPEEELQIEPSEELQIESNEELQIEPEEEAEDDYLKSKFIVEEEPDDIQEEEIILENTEHNSNILEVNDIDDDDDTPSGVNIDFD